MERRNAWKTYTQEQLKELDQINDRYKVCLDEGKTERECIRLTVKEIEKQGYRNLNDIKGSLKTGDKVYAVCMGKSIAMFRIGKEPLENGMNILGAHIDSPRIDVKQNPLYEDSDLVLLDTHYYGGIKKYQWVTLPLAIHGVVAKTDGSLVEVVIGEDENDPVVGISDLLIHLSQTQMEKRGNKVVEGEDLNVLVGSIPKKEKEKDAVILAHYYVDWEVQEIADYVGDSYYLAEIATKVPESTIVFCGVSFMGESAKILNPKKRVVMADGHADCPMAHMVDVDKIREVRNEYPDVSVVCYVNSTAEIKAESDVCVTSSNALKIVKNLPNKDIFFIPDENLGRFVASQLPEKHFIFNDGFCHVHKSIHKEELQKAKEAHPEALVLTHPECTGDI